MLPAAPEADELQQLPLELPRYLLVALRESGGHRAYALLPPYVATKLAYNRVLWSRGCGCGASGRPSPAPLGPVYPAGSALGGGWGLLWPYRTRVFRWCLDAVEPSLRLAPL